MNNNTLVQIFLYCHSDPFSLFLVCKSWNEVQQVEQFWKLMCFARWPSLLLLPKNHHLIEWKDLFRRRHFQIVEPIRNIRRAAEKLESSLDRKSFEEIQSLVEKEKQFNTLKSRLPLKKYPLKLQYFIDSALYSQVKVTEVMDNDNYLHTNQVQGTLMSLKGKIVPFSFQFNYFISSEGNRNWDETDHIQVSDARWQIPSSSVNKDWVAQVRRALEWSDASLDNVWDLLKITLIPNLPDLLQFVDSFEMDDVSDWYRVDSDMNVDYDALDLSRKKSRKRRYTLDAYLKSQLH